MEPQIGSTQRECFKEAFDHVLTQWFEHYNQARPHRGLGLGTPIARSDPVVTVGPIVCRERRGGLLCEYTPEVLAIVA